MVENGVFQGFRLPETFECHCEILREQNRGNPVLPQAKHNATGVDLPCKKPFRLPNFDEKKCVTTLVSVG
ncbi:MAG: hypothetical protein IJ143_04770 [Neisseriaceae bacterium]|nr:hypothetical protein [Neisseriaceae bacterium]